jgi:protocatechuate 3,4-dioxygenase beta subunit
VYTVLHAQALAALQGRVLDASGAVLRDAVVRVFNGSIGFDTAVRTDAEGRYRVFAVPAGTYTVVPRRAGSARFGWRSSVSTSAGRSFATSIWSQRV